MRLRCLTWIHIHVWIGRKYAENRKLSGEPRQDEKKLSELQKNTKVSKQQRMNDSQDLAI